MPSASGSIAPRARPSAPPRCRRAHASRSSACPAAGSRRQGTLAASTGRHGHRARTLDRAHARARLRRRTRSLRNIRADARGNPASVNEAAGEPLTGQVRVVGTAGHVDHGKSTLLTALTGMDPDRLQEERERGMTIDLGFAWVTLPGGGDIGFVDVPGHQDFIRNMLAGIGSIDAVLLVIAADEGVMPQTREHLAILGLLGIDRGVIALTKRDLVDDEWAALAVSDVRAALRGTPLADAPLVEVSATARRGLDELLLALERVLGEAPARRDVGRPRLPVDRSFTMSAFATVVTRTLLDGSLAVGDEIAAVPGDVRARVRGLQTHRRSLEVARPGRRVAANLSGIDNEAETRGKVVARHG